MNFNPKLWASLVPRDPSLRKPNHYAGMLRTAWDNRDQLPFMYRILHHGEPADIDTKDGRILIEDARQAVQELDQQGIYTYCINLDPKADEYVADIFGRHYTIVDNVAQLPIKLPELFIFLTK